jgi:hypothetical protein
MSGLPLLETEQGQRIKELEAHVERLRKFVINSNMISYEDEVLDFYEVDVREFQELIDESPAQSLREVQADAVEEALDKLRLSDSLYSGFHYKGTSRDSYRLGLHTQVATVERIVKQLKELK